MAKEPVGHDEQAYFYPLQSSLEEPEERYCDMKAIAEGGMKIVYEAQDKMTGRPVALAVLKNFEDPDHVEAFFLEARLGALLQHPNIMPVYDLGYLSAKRPFFAMKLISGSDLDKIIWSLRSGEDEFASYDLSSRLDLFLKVCDAIGYAHSKGVLHLDIKPANIQTGEYGEVLVCDWGVARLTTDPEQEEWGAEISFARGVTLHGMVKGTPGFMAPEQIDSLLGPKDCRSDIYALGALLYSLLFLRNPFEAFNAREIIDHRPGVEELDFSTGARHHVPKGLIAVVKRAMQARPDDRYSSVLQLKKEIAAYLSGYPTDAEEAGFIRQLQLLYQRNKRVSKLITASLLVLAAVSAFFMIRLRYNEQEAINALTLYEKGVKEKKEALELYLRQRKQATDLHNKYLEALASQRRSAMELIHLAERSFKAFSNYDNAIKYADLVLELKPEQMPKAYRVKALCYFVQQRFQESLGYFEKSGDLADSFLVDLAKEYGRAKNDGQLLSADETYTLFTRLIQVKRYKNMVLKMYDYLDNDNVKLKLALAEIVLSKQNPKQDNLQYSWYEEGGRFYVSVADNGELRNISCLRGLDIHSLNVENTEVSYIKDMSKSLVELNISNTRVKFLEFIKFMPKLRRLTLTKKNFSTVQLGFIHKKIDVVDR